jgi:hypothetical protein
MKRNFEMDSKGLSRRGVLTAGAAAVLAAAVPVAATMAPETAEAQTARPASASSSLTTVMSRSMDAGRAAAQFSDEPNHVGVVVFYGPEVDPVQYGDAFAQGLIKRGVNARSFAAPISQGLAIAYQVGATGIPEQDAQSAVNSIDEAVRLSQARDRVLSPTYTPTRGG